MVEITANENQLTPEWCKSCKYHDSKLENGCKRFYPYILITFEDGGWCRGWSERVDELV